MAFTGTQTAYEPRTQKAKSLYALRNANYDVPAFTIRNAAFYRDNPGMAHELINRFVRPCPMVPRHGFVDSRPVNSIEQAEQLISEALAAEPEAELIAMPFIAAEFSAIFTTGSLVIGPGNDGATLGHGSKVIPTIGHPGDSFQWSRAKQAAGITESPFCEILFEKKEYSEDGYSVRFVQLRNGPALPQTIDYIPAETKINRVVIAKAQNGKLLDETGKEIDLLEWETTAIELGKQTGTVVYHPNGSLASHCAVHCVLNNVPLITSFVPSVGDTLKPNTSKAEPNMEKMKAGFVLGCTAKMDYRNAVYAMLCAAHLTSVWIGKRDELLGFGMGCAYRLTIAAGLGEFRHRAHCVHGKESRTASRDAVYRGCWNKILTPSTRQRFVKAIASFSTESWGGSFGGKRWAAFCMFSADVFNALLENNHKKALASFNQTVHAAHNGGWAFDKFVNADTMNRAEHNPMTVLLPSAVTAYTAIQTIEEKPELAGWFKYRCKFETSDEVKAKAKHIASFNPESEDVEDEDEDNDYHCAFCGDSDCSGNCEQKKTDNSDVSKANPIIAAQVYLNKNDSVLHVQFKTKEQNGSASYSKHNILLTDKNGPKFWQEQLDNCEQAKSFAPDSQKIYYKATKIDSGTCKETSQLLFCTFVLNLGWEKVGY